MVEYLVVTTEGHVKELEKEVNNLLKNGWKLQGGVSVAITQGNYKIWAQALYRETN